MKTRIQFVGVDKRPGAEALLLKKLEKLYARYDWIHSADAYFKLEKKSAGKGSICEVKLQVPGQVLFASSDEDSFEKAADETVRDLDIQLRNRKGDFKPHM